MANYYGFTRTNYFAVNNPERIKEIIRKAVGAEDNVSLFERDFDGITKYGFGCYSTISGYESTQEDGDYDYDAFVADLQDVLASGDAIVITEVGYEKMNYLFATSQIITKEAIETVDIYDATSDRLCKIMGDDNFTTIFDY